jgi:hypothetical protein
VVAGRHPEAHEVKDPQQVARWIMARTMLARERYGEMLRLLCQLSNAKPHAR